jgi:hypothetical protein
VVGELERRGARPPAITWFLHGRQEASESRPNKDNDAGGLLGTVMISDVINSRDEYDVVLGHGTDVRSQTIGFKASLMYSVTFCLLYE